MFGAWGGTMGHRLWWQRWAEPCWSGLEHRTWASGEDVALLCRSAAGQGGGSPRTQLQGLP